MSHATAIVIYVGAVIVFFAGCAYYLRRPKDHGFGCSCGYEDDLGPCPYLVAEDQPYEDDTDYWGV